MNLNREEKRTKKVRKPDRRLEQVGKGKEKWEKKNHKPATIFKKGN